MFRLTFTKSNIAKILRRKKIQSLEEKERDTAHYFEFRNPFEKSYYKIYDFLIQPKIEKAISDFSLK